MPPEKETLKMEDINNNVQKAFFRIICNNEEIERIFNVKNAKDNLLKIRAETLVDNMRLYRVYRNKALAKEASWSLERSFEDSHYKTVLEKLPLDEKEACKDICYGDIFSNDPNGMIFNTAFGVTTTISTSLDFFLKFAHLAVMDFNVEVPMHVRVNSLRIAMRVMLQKEAMDFFMDPRGILPEDIAFDIHAPISLQKQFIAGHEFAHSILGHLSKEQIAEQPIFRAVGNIGEDYRPEKVYNNSQKNEFEADVQSLLLPTYNDQERGELLSAALLWFGCLELYEEVTNVISPKSSFSYQTHPPARERYDNLLSKIPTPSGFDTNVYKEFLQTIDDYKTILQDDITLQFDAYEMYGSIYLDAPNTLWRGPELIDRKDYY